MSSTESERSFPTLRHLKTWLRSSMARDRLTTLALLANVELMELKLEETAKDLVVEFAERASSY